MDPFAQSREDDDLFSDDFEPINEPTYVEDEAPSIPSGPQLAAPEPASEPVSNTSSVHAQPEQRGNARGAYGRGFQEGRGGQDRRQRGGRRGGQQNGLNNSRYASQAESIPPPSPSTSNQQQQPPQDSASSPTTSSEPSTTPIKSQNASPLPDISTRTPAVRGDRSATGGPAHKKLTEQELTAKLEKMAIINAQKAERHRLSEADQAAYQHREKELAKERREKAVAEKKNERVMEIERAKNRERKMKAQGGREWDSEKLESDIVDRKGRTSEYVRGGHGGVIGGGLAGSRYSAVEGEDDSTAPSRGRGGFEIRGRGRGGRGGRAGKASTTNSPLAPDDFPPLSDAPTHTPAVGGDWVSDAPIPTPAVGGDWADEMATENIPW